MTVRALILVPALMLASAGQAADLRNPHPVMREATGDGDLQAAIVVPACHESYWARLIRCEPRREVLGPHDIELLGIERTILQRRILPYPQLIDRP